jgi:hypothetical protein
VQSFVEDAVEKGATVDKSELASANVMITRNFERFARLAFKSTDRIVGSDYISGFFCN